MSEALIRDIAVYCRSIGIAESTFGRLAVNDGKLVGRLRLGGRVTTDTAERVRAFIAREPPPTINGTPTAALSLLSPPTLPAAPNFRFYDNRQKYLLFVTTCSEKQVVAQRVGMELANIHRARRHCACSMPAWATAPCWRGPCGRCTPASRRCRSTSSARN